MAIVGAQLKAVITVEGAEQAKAKLQGVGQEARAAGKSAQEGASGLSGMFKNALSFAAGGAIFAGIGFLKDQIGGIFTESMNAEAGLAQTNKVIESTHGVAGVTANAVLDLATNFSHLTKFSDDTVQAGENMLLTFTNIGKNVFPQATQTVLDMSQALGQDAKSSAIQLGKALNDPITGVSALQRVGVTFSQVQKDQIKHFMDTNNIAGAQGVILKELGKEFGGSAVAAGKTFGGQLAILGQRMDDIKQNIGDKLMPYLTRLMSFVSTNVVPALMQFSDWFINSGVPAIVAIVGKISDFVGWLQQGSAGATITKGVLIAFAGAIVAVLVVAFYTWAVAAGAAAVATIAATWPILAIGAVVALVVVGIIAAVKNWGAITKWFQGIWGAFAAWFGGVMSAIGTFFHNIWTGIQTFFVSIWNKIVSFAKTFGIYLIAAILGPAGIILALIITHWSQISAFISNTWNNIVNSVRGFIGNVITTVITLGFRLYNFFSGLAGQAVQWGANIIRNLASGIIGAIASAIGGAMNAVGSFIHDHLPSSPAKIGPLKDLEFQGANISKQIASGMVKNLPTISASMNMMLQPIASPQLSSLAPSAMMGGHGPITVVVNVQPPDMNMDGVRLSRALMPHIANAIRYNTGGFGR